MLCLGDEALSETILVMTKDTLDELGYSVAYRLQMDTNIYLTIKFSFSKQS